MINVKCAVFCAAVCSALFCPIDIFISVLIFYKKKIFQTIKQIIFFLGIGLSLENTLSYKTKNIFFLVVQDGYQGAVKKAFQAVYMPRQIGSHVKTMMIYSYFDRMVMEEHERCLETQWRHGNDFSRTEQLVYLSILLKIVLHKIKIKYDVWQ